MQKTANAKKSGKYTSALLVIILTSAIVAGIYINFHISFKLAEVDPDSSHSAMLWYGTEKYGVSFIKNWIFTTDNWLLTLFPIDSALFTLFGPKPHLVLIRGWLFFVLSTILSGVIARQLNAKWSSLLIPTILLFSGYYSIAAGFLTYPVSHNSSLFFGILTLVFIIQYIKDEKKAWPIFIFALLTIASISDPWFFASYALPSAIAAVAAYFADPQRPKNRQFIIIFISASAALIVARTLAFGALSFLPTFPFDFGTSKLIKNNIGFFIKDLSGLLNLIPPPAPTNQLIQLASLSSAATLLIIFSYKFFKLPSTAKSGAQIFFLATSAISISGISFAFIFSNIQQADYSARFLVNILFFTITTISIYAEKTWKNSNLPLKYFAAACAFLFIISGLLSIYQAPTRNIAHSPDTKARDILDFLKSHNLDYGYGPYWGSYSNAVTWLSGNKIVIRPVTFDPKTGFMQVGHRGESDKLWYTANDLPKAPQNYFIFVTNDHENCPNIQVCVNGVIKQYGKPIKIFRYKGAYVMVWPHELLWPLVKIGEKISLKTSHGWLGWSSPEKWGTWTDAKVASIILPLYPAPDSDLYLIIDSSAFLARSHQSQTVKVTANGIPIGSLNYTQTHNLGQRAIKIPLSVLSISSDILKINLIIQNPTSPASLGVSADSRDLGIAVTEIEISRDKP